MEKKKLCPRTGKLQSSRLIPFFQETSLSFPPSSPPFGWRKPSCRESFKRGGWYRSLLSWAGFVEGENVIWVSKMRHGAKHSSSPSWRSHCAGEREEGGSGLWACELAPPRGDCVGIYKTWRRGRRNLEERTGSAAPVSNNDHEQGTFVTPRQTPFITRCPSPPPPPFVSCPAFSSSTNSPRILFRFAIFVRTESVPFFSFPLFFSRFYTSPCFDSRGFYLQYLYITVYFNGRKF